MNNSKLKAINNEKVTVFMPCFNLGAYIEEALASVLSQTFTKFQVIIADDCSTDKYTIRKLKEIKARKDNRVEVYFEPKNLGMNKLTAKYIAMATTEYVIMFSPDDILSPAYLEETVNYLDSHPDTAAVTTNIQCFGESEQIIIYSQEGATLPGMLLENGFCGSSLVRRTAVEDIPFYDPSNQALHEDYDLWLRLLSKGSKLSIIPKTLFNYRILSTSASHSVTVEKEIEWKKYLVRKHADLYKTYSTDVIIHLWEKLLESNSLLDKVARDYDSLYETYVQLERESYSQKQDIIEMNQKIQSTEEYINKIRYFSLFPYLRILKKIVRRIRNR